MPSSGACQVGQRDHAKAIDAYAAVQRHITDDHLALDHAAGGARAHPADRGQAELARQ